MGNFSVALSLTEILFIINIIVMVILAFSVNRLFKCAREMNYKLIHPDTYAYSVPSVEELSEPDTSTSSNGKQLNSEDLLNTDGSVTVSPTTNDPTRNDWQNM